MSRTRGAELLKERFPDHGDQERFREAFNDGLEKPVDAPTVSRWFTGKVRPSLEQIVQINEVLKARGMEEITITLWAESIKETA